MIRLGFPRRVQNVMLAAALGLVLAGCQSMPAVPQEVAAMTPQEKEWLAKGDAARSLGKHAEAEAHYKQAVTLSKGAVRAHLELADLYRRQGDVDAETRVLEAAYRLNPANLEIVKALAQNALLSGDAAKAGRLADEGLAASPNDIRLLNLRGIALDHQGLHDAAQRAYARAIEHSANAHDREVTANNQALSLIAAGQYDQAIDILTYILPLSSDRVAVRQLLALAYGVKGEADAAYELGLQDLSLQQVNENLRFYERLRKGEVPMRSLFAPAG